MAVADREKALQAALAQIEKAHGKGSIMRLGEDVRQPIETIPTGSIALDIALGIGGLPRGRVVEVYGPESSGKTTVALHAIANAQAAGGICAFIDAEHALDPEYAAKLGVDTDALLVSQPDNGEQALEIADMLVRSGALTLLVIDSVAALTPRAEIEGEMGDSHVGLQARLMSQALRKMTGALSHKFQIEIMKSEIGFLQEVQRHPGDHFRTGNTIEPLVVGIELTDPIGHEPFKRLAVLQLVMLGLGEILPQLFRIHRIDVGFGFINAFACFARHIRGDEILCALVRERLRHVVEELALAFHHIIPVDLWICPHCHHP